MPSVAALALAAGRGKLRPHEGAACCEVRVLCSAAAACWAEALDRWLHGESAALYFAGARALALQPPGALALGVDGLGRERGALQALTLLRRLLRLLCQALLAVLPTRCFPCGALCCHGDPPAHTPPPASSP